jgi:hypothetical protein
MAVDENLSPGRVHPARPHTDDRSSKIAEFNKCLSSATATTCAHGFMVPASPLIP